MNTWKPGFGFWFGIIITVVFGGVLFFMFHSEAAKTKFLRTASTRDIAFSCTTDMATKFHIHPMLKIVIDGVNQVIPSEIGIDGNACMHPIHTHDETGRIHVESPIERDFTLGDFFAVWKQPFSSMQIMDKTVSGKAKLTMTVNGIPSTQFENLVLKDNDEIVITYSSK